MDGVQLTLEGPDPGDRVPPRISVAAGGGIYTDGPYALLEATHEIEFTLEELQWLRDRALPAAIAKLTELKATGG